jgi:hypothetical protein
MTAVAVAERARRDEEGRIVLAAALGSLAEAALWYLPASQAAREVTGSGTGPLVWFWAFVPGFTAVVVALTVLRHSTRLPVVGAMLGVAIGAWAASIGQPDPVGRVIVAAIGIAVALRTVTLATRDWRDPVAGSLAWGSVLILAEASIAHGLGWDRPLSAIVPMFFLGALASRAVSASIGRAGAGAHGEARTRRSLRWPAWMAAGLLVVAGGMAVAVAMGTPGGALQGLGRVAVPLAVLVAVFGAFAATEQRTEGRPVPRGGRWMGVLPFVAIVALILIAMRNRATRQRFVTFFNPPPLHQHAYNYSATARIMGFLLFLAVALLLLRAFRARWAEPASGQRTAAPPPRVGAARRPPGASRLRRPRHELPADTVRRWYAETLVLLEAKNLPRPPARTPAEFVGDVGRDIPEVRDGMARLTRAYERVRYGSVTIDGGTLHSLDAERRELTRTISQREPIERDDEDPARR